MCMVQGWWSRSKSEGANFYYEIWEVEDKSQVYPWGIGGLAPGKFLHLEALRESILDPFYCATEAAMYTS